MIQELGKRMDAQRSQRSFFCFGFFFFFFCLFAISWAAPMTYGGSQARGQIRPAAAGLYHSHSNVGSKPHL